MPATADIAYEGNLDLLHPSALAPIFTDLGGFVLQCSLAAGALPTGMTLHPDCTITGTPTEAGVFQPTIRVTAAGTSDVLQAQFDLSLAGPSTQYDLPASLSAGTSVDLSPQPSPWVPLPGDSLQYSVAGALPAGLSLDPATGRMTGVIVQPGHYVFGIDVSLTNGSLSTTAHGTQVGKDVYAAMFTYSTYQAYVGVPFVATPSLAGSWQYAATLLPPGLSLDTTTGVISGVPTVLPAFGNQPVTATGSTGYQATTVTPNVSLPVTIRYPDFVGHYNQPMSLAPVVTNVSGADLSGATFTYAQLTSPNQALPPGLTLNATTGVISGTVTSSSVLISPDITITVNLNGATFTKTVGTNIVFGP